MDRRKRLSHINGGILGAKRCYGRMKRNGNPDSAATQSDVGSFLAQDLEIRLFQSPNDIGAGNTAGKFHAAASTGSSMK
jgi:hypothetical protein